MRWQRQSIFFIVIILGVQGLGDPYKILGVRKSATVQEIRKAYKQLAKEWHPDKNNDPKAENKFVEITQAYELLTDPERRKNYDNFGITENEALHRNKKDYSQYRKYDPLDDLFGPNFGSFKFHYQDHDITLFHKLSITTRGYESKLVPRSRRVPHLVLFYSDWCFPCLQVEPVWRRAAEELGPLGLGLATVHAEKEQPLARKLGVKVLPAVALVVDGKAFLYGDASFSLQRIVEFVRSKFPYRMVQPINDDNVDVFLSGWVDNRVRALIFERHEAVRLRYLLMAFYYRDRVAFGFVQLNSANSKNIQKRFKVPSDIETLLLFNENVNRPAASLSMSDMPIKTMQDIINSNKYLLLPRLSSQEMLDTLCPPEWARPRKRLCVVLVCRDTPGHDEPRRALRQFAQESPHSADRVRYAYVFQERQAEFVSALTGGEGSPAEPLLHVVFIWRRDASHIKYEWLSRSWTMSSSQEWNETRERLEATIQRLLHDSEALSYEAVVQELIDEHAQGILTRILTKLLLTADFLKDNVTKDQLLPVISVVVTVVFVVIAGYIMSYLMRLEEESIRKGYQNGEAFGEATASVPGDGSNAKPVPSSELRLHELRAETYNGMVRLLKPGCRTIILLVDMQSRNKLIAEFHRIIWPYRKNKTLMFGFMCLEHGLDWYKSLLTLSLPEPRDLKINPRNCIGTVLSLNGHRKYFCMYHAKHPECMKVKGSKRMVKMTKHFSNQPSSKSGAFIGFDSSDSDDTETSDVEIGNRHLDKSNLLDGLPNWLDRLFEGTTHRFHINYWPDFSPK
ncbi:dnaJ homolog subfamily C member 16 isoform X2 [Bacillus rossius redtenbacheri]|uniref:dnaJ homolog subfamily C member 16 isoform X2 n=1 Tax=Bacillus rossius redtenbacheri TaxID=93214 RepID=UPI002FDECC41